MSDFDGFWSVNDWLI